MSKNVRSTFLTLNMEVMGIFLLIFIYSIIVVGTVSRAHEEEEEIGEIEAIEEIGEIGKIRRHESEGIIDLVPGEDRGTITLPLRKGTIESTGEDVYFVLSDVSDDDFASQYGGIPSDALSEAPEAAVEHATFDDGVWTFFEDAGLVCRFDDDGNVLPPLANPNYSPLKRFEWNGETVTANVPFIKWGDGPGQKILVDEGGCDPLVRSNPPSPFFVGGGPANGADCSTEGPLDRYKGGQAVDINLDAMTVTMKLHKATFRHPDKVPYYTVFEASKAPPAGFGGTIVAPKLGNLGRFGENDAAGRITQFANGVRNNSGGPNRYQQGITSYRGGDSDYTPMWHISWIFFDCNDNGIFFDTERNVGEGGTPDPAPPETFDPFAMDDKGVDCPVFATEATGNTDGFIERLSHLEDLIEDGFAIETEGPAGLRLDSPLQPPLIVNCPVPLTLR